MTWCELVCKLVQHLMWWVQWFQINKVKTNKQNNEEHVSTSFLKYNSCLVSSAIVLPWLAGCLMSVSGLNGWKFGG